MACCPSPDHVACALVCKLFFELRRVQKYDLNNGGQVVYPELSCLDWKRRATFAGLTADPFKLTLFYPGPRAPCCLPEGGLYATYTVTGLNDVLKKYNDTTDVTARFYLDSDGMPRISGVEIARVYNETEMVTKMVPDDSAGAHRSEPLAAVGLS